MCQIAFKAGIFVILQRQDGFESGCPETKFNLKKIAVQKSIAELWAVISNQIIKYQLSHMRLDQNNGYNHNTSMKRYSPR